MALVARPDPRVRSAAIAQTRPPPPVPCPNRAGSRTAVGAGQHGKERRDGGRAADTGKACCSLWPDATVPRQKLERRVRDGLVVQQDQRQQPRQHAQVQRRHRIVVVKRAGEAREGAERQQQHRAVLLVHQSTYLTQQPWKRLWTKPHPRAPAVPNVSGACGSMLPRAAHWHTCRRIWLASVAIVVSAAMRTLVCAELSSRRRHWSKNATMGLLLAMKAPFVAAQYEALQSNSATASTLGACGVRSPSGCSPCARQGPRLRSAPVCTSTGMTGPGHAPNSHHRGDPPLCKRDTLRQQQPRHSRQRFSAESIQPVQRRHR